MTLGNGFVVGTKYFMLDKMDVYINVYGKTKNGNGVGGNNVWTELGGRRYPYCRFSLFIMASLCPLSSFSLLFFVLFFLLLRSF